MRRRGAAPERAAEGGGVKLDRGARYAGSIVLRGLEKLASAGMVKSRLESAGFGSVVVSRELAPGVKLPAGATYYGAGTWERESQRVKLPSQITQMVRL
jgi:hypothetical protein